MVERDGEPTEQPTPRRLAEARRQGRIARSRELTGAAAFAGALVGFAATARSSAAALRNYLAAALGGAVRGGPLRAGAALSDGLWVGARVVLPVAVAAALAAAVVGGLQARGLFTLSPLLPSLARLSPLGGLRRMFSRAAGAQALGSLAKLVGVGLVAYWVLAARAAELAGLVSRTPEVSLGVVAAAAMALALRVAVLLALLGVLELLQARRALLRELRMTRRELLRELKETEGDPHHKAARARALGEVTDHERSLAVAGADCLIVSEAVAVALAYRPAPDDALEVPRVVARAAGLAATRLCQLARQHGVPVYRDAALARVLGGLEPDDAVPEPLWEAAAEVLRFAHRVTGGARGAA